ncbi:putative hydroxypyruvate isomerase [Dunckerocampus dactyliophorus]|uniref:putative hydroxypyruvate isomerase n=1 Tax=Dunckerocampus dactyliophorus TaxID=161453 RepID=UPI0024058646|nr:putative hydroxypyruvate isomerase [Dunckerocampus dactyliophorus]
MYLHLKVHQQFNFVHVRPVSRSILSAGPPPLFVVVIIIRCVAGDLSGGDLGLGAIPGREAEFKEGLAQAIKLAKALDCKRIHLMAGKIPKGAQRGDVAKEMEAIFVQNLTYAAELLSKDGIVGLIEPINTRLTEPRYFLDSPHQAAAILQKVGKANIQLQMDVFHWQIMDGNLTHNMHKYLPLIGHVQVAQVPGRNEPDSAGELNYNYIFTTLEELGYQGYVGCEYKPRGSTQEGLGWLKDFWNNRK